jgi:hypothetical protein
MSDHRARSAKHDTRARARAGVATFAALGLLACGGVLGQPAQQSARIVAVSDVHGAYDALVDLLRAAKLVDDKVEWAGGGATLVVDGDTVDRGSGSRRVLELLMRLEAESRAAGGRAQLVLGNHEVMNLTGELDYVTAEDYAAYASDESAAERKGALERFRAARASATTNADELAAEFAQRYPPGFFAQRAAFASGGKLGAWLLRQPVLLVIGETAFVHGGLPAALAGKTVAEVNAEYSAALHDYLAAFDALVAAGVLHAEDSFGDRPLLAERVVADARRAGASAPAQVGEAAERLKALTASAELGPEAVYWYRGTVSCGEAIERDRVARLLETFGAKRVVVGHTPVATARVVSRFDGAVLRIDTGMQQRGGRAAALVLEGDAATALYAGEPAGAPIAEQPRLVGPRVPGYDDARLADALANAPITARAKRDDGTVQLKLAVDGGEIDALFDPAGGKRGARLTPAVGAYRLDKLLGFDLVPVAAKREIDGAIGAVYLDPSRLPDETARAGERAGADAWCPLEDQFASMYVFDALAGSEGRTPAELRYTPGSWQLALTGNRRLFATAPTVPAYLSEQALEVSPWLAERLRGLDTKAAEAALGDGVDESRVQALLARRDALLAPRAGR